MEKLNHYKQIVLDGIKENDNPQTWRIRQWLNAEHINVKRLLNTMQREGLISIEFQEDRGKVRRILKQKNKIEL